MTPTEALRNEGELASLPVPKPSDLGKPATELLPAIPFEPGRPHRHCEQRQCRRHHCKVLLGGAHLLGSGATLAS